MTYRNDRPNHFMHDSLGDPLTCTGDHNHPGDERERPSKLMEYLRSIGVKSQVRTLKSGNKVLQIRVDKLREAEGGVWDR